MFYLIFTFSISVFIFHFSLPLFTCSFPSLNILTICDQSHCPWPSLQFSLQGAAFFLVLSSSGLSLLDFTFIASPQSFHRLCWAGPPSAWNCPGHWANAVAGSPSFPSLWDHGPMMTLVQCLKTMVPYAFSISLVVYDRRAI